MPSKTRDQTFRHELISDIQTALGSPPDLVCRHLILHDEQNIQCVYLESMVNTDTIDQYVFQMLRASRFSEKSTPGAESGGFLREYPFSEDDVQVRHNVLKAILEGHCLLIDNANERVCLLDTTETKFRPIEEPKSEPTIRGPHEGFTETIDVNIGLVRKRIRSPMLRFEMLEIGSETRTTVLLAYMENLAPEALVREVRSRLAAIRTNSLLESAYVEEFIQDETWTPFPTLLNTERPDKVAAQLLEGKAAVFVDGTPYVLLAPVTFFELFVSTEDYYQRADIATFIRWIRVISFFVAVYAPSLYVAVTTFHQELIPTQLLISLSAQREGVPLSAFMEIVLMEIMFEIIREAGLRMPRAVGQALSIVGAIVLGQAAVEAGLISAAVVIVVAVTGITNFVVPVYSFGMSQRLLRFSFVLLAGFMGLFGILCGTLFLIAHLVSLKSFGVPYMIPLSPAFKSDWKDMVVRSPRPAFRPDRLPAPIRWLKRK